MARKDNEKFYLKYLSTASVSSGVAEQQPAGGQPGKQQRGGGGGGGRSLPGGRVEYDTWKAKAEDSHHR